MVSVHELGIFEGPVESLRELLVRDVLAVGNQLLRLAYQLLRALAAGVDHALEVEGRVDHLVEVVQLLYGEALFL